MSQQTLPSPGEAGFKAVLTDDIVNKVRDFIGDANSIDSDERRSRPRFPIYCCMQLTPVSSAGSPIRHETTTVVGKDISANGISFSHDSELNAKRLIISLELPDVGQLCVEAEVMWSRQSPIGLYDCGCRLIRKIST